MSGPKSTAARANAASRLRLNPATVWEDRTTLAKRELEAERAATDAKTAKLRALRLAKEAADRENSAIPENASPATKPPARKPAAPIG